MNGDMKDMNGNIKVFENHQLNERLYHYVHPSGLNAFLMPKKGYSRSYAAFATHYGSINSRFILPGDTGETAVPDGIAHFLEHKLFDQKDGSIMDKFNELGSSPNAYTSSNATVYLFSCTDRFDDNLRLLLNFVQNPWFTDESVEKEKGIIAQEIRMYDDNPGWKVYFNFLSAAYHNHPVRTEIAGTVESISQINKDLLYLCYNAFYHPSNMVLFACGDLEPDEVFRIVDEEMQASTPSGEIRLVFPKEPSSVRQHYTEQSLPVSVPLFYCGFKDIPDHVKGPEAVKYEMALKLILRLLLGRSTDLFTRMYEKGLINNTFETDVILEEDYCYSVFGGESREPEKVREAVLDEIRRVMQSGIDKGAFERIKNAVKGSYIRNFNSPEILSRIFLNQYFKDFNFLDLPHIYDKISVNYAESVLKKHFNPDNLVLSVIRPV